jgi:sulfite reductase (NADPH) flavoprotein alpha-component
MSSAVIIQGNFPIPEDRRDQLQQLATELNREQLMWLSGYFAGAAAAAPSSIPGFQANLLGGQARAQHAPAAAPAAFTHAAAAPAAAPLPTLTIISASHTGNGRKISEKLLAAVQALGMQARMIKAGDYQPREIAKEKLLYVVISTHGDGDPPDEARALYEFLGTKRAPQLPELQYSVLSLGDTSYPKFCEAGRVVDERLAKLGPSGCCRASTAMSTSKSSRRPGPTTRSRACAEIKEKLAPVASVAYRCRSGGRACSCGHRTDARQSATAEVLANQRIVGRGRSCAKCGTWNSRSRAWGTCTRPAMHSASCTANPGPAIDAVLKATKLDGAAAVTHDGKNRIRCSSGCATSASSRALRVRCGAGRQTRERGYLRAARQRTAMAKLTATCQVSDILGSYPADWDSGSLGERAAPVTGRVYSIASSPAAVGDEAHLTVAVVGSDTDRKLLAAPPRISWSTRPSIRTCRCGSRRTIASACRPMAHATSSWSGRAPASRRSAGSCRSARPRAPPARTGCSSVAARCTTTSSTSSNGSRR